MKADGKKTTSLWVENKNQINIIDQTKLPFKTKIINLKNISDFSEAITKMKVRGAPLIGVTAAFVASLVIDKNFFTLLLSYCPGGIYEVAVIAIFFDLDPEFVSFHHIIRLLMILFAVPIILKLISKKA